MSSSSPLRRTAISGAGLAGTGVPGDPEAGGSRRGSAPFMKLLASLTIGISAGLAACSLAPRYQRPDTAGSPAEYREALGWKLATPSDIEPRGPWWTVFQDPALDALETQVTDANQDLKAAFARLQEARAQTRMAGAAQSPSVTADARATRAQASVNSPTYPP